ncbi:MAG: glycosidase, partial [Hyperthermus sp.]
KTLYEIYGDRPYTIFPCGLWQLNGKEALITYGAADYMAGIGLLNIDELKGLLDKGLIG